MWNTAYGECTKALGQSAKTPRRQPSPSMRMSKIGNKKEIVKKGRKMGAKKKIQRKSRGTDGNGTNEWCDRRSESHTKKNNQPHQRMEGNNAIGNAHKLYPYGKRDKKAKSRRKIDVEPHGMWRATLEEHYENKIENLKRIKAQNSTFRRWKEKGNSPKKN